MDLCALIHDLTRPAAYDHPADTVDVRQTHISVLFFAGDRVYKVKKPVNLGFLDFSTLDQRRHFCEEEVRLNRRLAPQDYLGVSAITRDGAGRLRIGGDGEPVEYAVRMRRLPHDRMLDQLLDRGSASATEIEQIVGVLVPFHAGAASGPEVDAHGQPEAVRQRIAGNLNELEEVLRNDGGAAQPVPVQIIERIRAIQERFIDDHHALLRRRVEDRRIREGHGDLHAANICLLDDRIVIYDCIEFSFAFRCCDVACDLAFLTMDLAYRGRDDLRAALIERYAAAANDPVLPRLVPFYERHYALVRAKVRLIEAGEAETDEAQRAKASDDAVRYVLYAAASAGTGVGALILTCGLPASGKSWLARRVASILHADHVRSDVVRKRLAGLNPRDRGSAAPDTGIYTPAWTERTYKALLQQAAQALERGRSIIVDANFPTRDLRAPFIELAQSLGAPLLVLHVEATDEVARQRLEARQRDRDDVSDAGVEVYERARARFQPPDEVDREHLLRIQSPAEPPHIHIALKIAGMLLAQL